MPYTRLADETKCPLGTEAVTNGREIEAVVAQGVLDDLSEILPDSKGYCKSAPRPAKTVVCRQTCIPLNEEQCRDYALQFKGTTMARVQSAFQSDNPKGCFIMRSADAVHVSYNPASLSQALCSEHKQCVCLSEPQRLLSSTRTFNWFWNGVHTVTECQNKCKQLKGSWGCQYSSHEKSTGACAIHRECDSFDRDRAEYDVYALREGKQSFSSVVM